MSKNRSRYFLEQAHSHEDLKNIRTQWADMPMLQRIQHTFCEPEFEKMFQDKGYFPRTKAYFQKRPAMLEQIRQDYQLPDLDSALRGVICELIEISHSKVSNLHCKMGNLGERGVMDPVPVDQTYSRFCHTLEGTLAHKAAIESITMLWLQTSKISQSGYRYTLKDLDRNELIQLIKETVEPFGVNLGDTYPMLDQQFGDSGFRFNSSAPDKGLRVHTQDTMRLDLSVIEPDVWGATPVSTQLRMLKAYKQRDYEDIHSEVAKGDKLAKHLVMQRIISERPSRAYTQADQKGISGIANQQFNKMAFALGADCLRAENYDMNKAHSRLEGLMASTLDCYIANLIELKVAAPDNWASTGLSKSQLPGSSLAKREPDALRKEALLNLSPTMKQITNATGQATSASNSLMKENSKLKAQLEKALFDNQGMQKSIQTLYREKLAMLADIESLQTSMKAGQPEGKYQSRSNAEMQH